MNLEKIYDKNYKKLLLIPLILLILSISFLIFNYFSTGGVIERDVSLKGGISVIIEKEGLNENEISSYLNSKFNSVIVRTLTDLSTMRDIGLIIESSDAPEDELKDALKEKISFTEEQYSAEIYSQTFSESFYRQLIYVLLFAFILMSITVAITFRSFAPSITVIGCALTDILITLGIVSLFGLQISAGGITAFLLIIGYSIDTDILLATKLIKRSIGTKYDRLKQAITTGLTMILTTITALLIGFAFSTAPVLKEIFSILIVALVIDIITTYFWSAPVLIWYMKKRNMH